MKEQALVYLLGSLDRSSIASPFSQAF